MAAQNIGGLGGLNNIQLGDNKNNAGGVGQQMQPNPGLDQSVNDPNANDPSFDFGDSPNVSKDQGRPSIGSEGVGGGLRNPAGLGNNTQQINTGAGSLQNASVSGRAPAA